MSRLRVPTENVVEVEQPKNQQHPADKRCSFVAWGVEEPEESVGIFRRLCSNWGKENVMWLAFTGTESDVVALKEMSVEGEP